jgi:hypothetical protein
MREVINEYYSGQGRILIGKRDNATGRAYGFRHVGNCSALSVDIAVEKFAHKESTSGLRAQDLSVVKSQTATMKTTCESLSNENLALGLYGKSTKVAGAAVVDEFHPFDTVDAGVIALDFPNVSLVTVKTGADKATATAVANVQNAAYEVDPTFGTIYVKDKTKFTGANVYVSYTYGASTKLDVFTNPVPAEVAVRFEGLNTINGEAVLITIPRVTFDPLTGLQFINDELSNAEFTGNVLLDPKIDASTGSQFMSKFTIPASAVV